MLHKSEFIPFKLFHLRCTIDFKTLIFLILRKIKSSLLPTSFFSENAKTMRCIPGSSLPNEEFRIKLWTPTDRHVDPQTDCFFVFFIVRRVESVKTIISNTFAFISAMRRHLGHV